ncbi:MAG: type II toxin-antitoxin system HicB family antitoxin [Firmicutes bacterium]|nr:type II toxin-antitoxin system HicB family antitoxin [Bacillota bacterium]
MSNILTYRGYSTEVKYDSESNVLYGKIEGIKDLVNFECAALSDVVLEFHSAVDDYLTVCQENGEEPEKPFKGKFNVRIDPDLHRRLWYLAMLNGASLNHAVESAIREYLETHAESQIKSVSAGK